MRILLFLFIISFLPCKSQSLFHNIISQGSGGGDSLNKISVKYSNTLATTLTGSANWTDAGTFQTGLTGNPRVVGVMMISPNLQPNTQANANTGLSYDQTNDLFVVNDFINTRFFTRANLFADLDNDDYTTITTTRTITASGSPQQGIAMNSYDNTILVLIGNTTINICDADDGSLITATTIDDTGSGGSLTYIEHLQELWKMPELQVQVRRYKLVGTVWTYQSSFWWDSNEGTAYDGINERFVGHRSDFIVDQRLSDGFGIRNWMYPLAAMTNGATNREGIIVDPRTGLIVYNYPAYYHGGITKGNRLWITDPKQVYQRYLYFPDMIRYDKFNKTSTVTGQFGRQTLVGGDWNESPVIDFESFTEQQTLANWTSPEQFDIEFRGSASAPTTTADTEFHLDTYDANQTNSGWGATSPGSWQSTPTTNRYMQFRVKVKTPVAETPTLAQQIIDLLGSKLKLLYLWNDYGYTYMRANDQNNPQTPNLKNPTFNYMRSSVVANMPYEIIASSPNHLLDDNTNRNFVVDGGVTLLGSDNTGEVTVVGRRESAAVSNFYLAMSKSTSNNNAIIMGHGGSGLAAYWGAGTGLQNAPLITTVDNSGNISTVSAPADATTTYKMLSFVSTGSAWEIYVDKVSQTLTVRAGSNAGAWFNDLTTPDVVSTGYVYQTAASGASQGRMRAELYSDPLTTQERSDLYDLFVAAGLL